MGHVRSQLIFVLASPYWPCWSFSTGQSGVHFLHPSIRYVRFHLKTERKGSKSTQAVYFCEAKVFSAVILVNHRMPTSGFGVLDGITQCDLWVRHNQVKSVAEFDERFLLFSDGEFSEEAKTRGQGNSPVANLGKQQTTDILSWLLWAFLTL